MTLAQVYSSKRKRKSQRWPHPSQPNDIQNLWLTLFKIRLSTEFPHFLGEHDLYELSLPQMEQSLSAQPAFTQTKKRKRGNWLLQPVMVVALLDLAIQYELGDIGQQTAAPSMSMFVAELLL